MLFTILGILLIIFTLWKYYFVVETTPVPGGYKEDVILPYTDAVEFYFADISSMSMKVRMCLAEAKVQFKPHLTQLVRSFATKSPEFLRVNPAGTVPVLVHHGHPIHESSEQMKYIAQKLVSPDGPQLMPLESEAKSDNEYWIELTSMYMSEMKAGPTKAFKKRAGNCVPFISMLVLPSASHETSLKHILLGLIKFGIRPKPIMEILFWCFGVYVFKFIPKLGALVKGARNELLLHLAELDNFLKVRETKYISGDDITIADISWATILERMDLVGLWEHVDSVKYATVLRYWNDLRSLLSYKEATKLAGLDPNFLIDMKSRIKQMKEEYPFYKSLFQLD